MIHPRGGRRWQDQTDREGNDSEHDPGASALAMLAMLAMLAIEDSAEVLSASSFYWGGWSVWGGWRKSSGHKRCEED